MTDTSEDTAQRIAQRGREALLLRLRPAFEDAAAKHSDVLHIDGEKLELMVQGAADRADGLLWRRALATVATDELGIGLAEALDHPAVARAQEIVGAPSYEDSLATLRSRRSPYAEMPEPAVAPPEAVAPEAPMPAEPEAAQIESEQPARASSPDRQASEAATGPAMRKTRNTLRLRAVHASGVADLEPGEDMIELRISRRGLDIVRGADEILGRLLWPEIEALYVPTGRGLRRRKRQGQAQLVIRTAAGDANFEIPDVVPSELTEQLTPLVQRFGRR